MKDDTSSELVKFISIVKLVKNLSCNGLRAYFLVNTNVENFTKSDTRCSLKNTQ